jgi:hypothetical protein
MPGFSAFRLCTAVNLPVGVGVMGEGGCGFFVIWRVCAQGPLTYLAANASSQEEG